MHGTPKYHYQNNTGGTEFEPIPKILAEFDVLAARRLVKCWQLSKLCGPSSGVGDFVDELSQFVGA